MPVPEICAVFPVIMAYRMRVSRIAISINAVPLFSPSTSVMSGRVKWAALSVNMVWS